MDTTLVKKGVVNAFIGILNDLTKKEIEELQDLLSVKLHKLNDSGERIPLEQVKKELKLNQAKKE
jgi:hypothetical protein